MEETIRLTMAQALIRYLDQQYLKDGSQSYKFVDSVQGIFGHGNVTGIGEALENESHQLRFIRGNNEQGMVHTAIAFAKQKRRRQIMAVTSSIGPGATNMVTGAATATINRIPVLLLCGDGFSCRQPDPVLQQLEHPLSHQISVNDCFKPVSRYWDRIDRPEQLMLALHKAMQVLVDPEKTGAVTLCLPQDVQSEAFEYPVRFFKPRVHTLNRPVPQPGLLSQAMELLGHSERPLIIAGGGVLYSHAHQELAQLAERFAIPVVETQAGKGALLCSHPMNLGGLGVIGTEASNRLFAQSDCILALGTRMGDFITASKSTFNPQKQKLIAVNLDPFDGLKLEPSVWLQADIKTTLACFLKNEGLKETSGLYQQEVASQQQHWQNELERLRALPAQNSDQLFDQKKLLIELNHLIAEDSIVVCAAGSLPGDLQRLWQCKTTDSYHLEYGYSCMGYEVAGGLGSLLAAPSREVWVVVGDGSFLMLHSELVTAIQERVALRIVLFDSVGFNCIKGLQMSQGSKGYGTDLLYREADKKHYGEEKLSINFAQYAQALGCQTHRAHSLSEFSESINKMRSSSRASLLEVKVAEGSQSQGYSTWWRVGANHASKSCEVLEAGHSMQAKIEQVIKY